MKFEIETTKQTKVMLQKSYCLQTDGWMKGQDEYGQRYDYIVQEETSLIRKQYLKGQR